ncbi:MAG: flagellar export protein FliJ [Gammaproteobacteria bacterium]
MSRKKSQRIQTVVRLARHEEEEAALALSQARQVLEEQLQRLQELESYRHEYAQRINRLGGAGVHIAQLNEYRSFIARLDEAIQQQRQRTVQCQAELEQRSDGWQAARLRHRSVDKYRQRCVSEEQRLALKKEQKESDERAQHRRPLPG